MASMRLDAIIYGDGDHVFPAPEETVWGEEM